MPQRDEMNPRYEVIVPRGTYDFYTVIDHESDIRPNFEVVVIHKEIPNAEGEARGIADRLNGCKRPASRVAEEG
jgi:hypothetical protein